MKMMIVITTMVMILSAVIMLITLILSKKTSEDREKSSPFECGFDPKSSSRMPFSLRFFLIAVLFLIFDVEIALLLPMTIIAPVTTIYSWMLTSMLFLTILLVGLYHEWNQGSLQWAT